jgi:hypothetical protein
MSLTVRTYELDQSVLLPLTLKELRLEGRAFDCQQAEPLTRLTQLTSLRIGIRGDGDDPFEAITALTALQSLDINASASLIPFVAKLAQLTHLCFVQSLEVWPLPSMDMEPLTRLPNLVHLQIGAGHDLTPQQLRAVGAITTLRSLDLSMRREPEVPALEGTFSTPFTRLSISCLREDWSYLSR